MSATNSGANLESQQIWFLNNGTFSQVTPLNPFPVEIGAGGTGSITVNGTVVAEAAPVANFVSGVGSTAASATGVSVIAAPGANLKNYITGVVVSNSGSVSSTVTIQSDPLGTPTTLMVVENPSGGGSNPSLGAVPLVGGTNKAVGFTCGSASTTQFVTLIGYTGA